MNRVLEQFRDQINHFLDDLITICPTEQDFIKARMFFSVVSTKSVPVQTGIMSLSRPSGPAESREINMETIMASFIKYVYPWKDQILKRDALFFRDNQNPFGELPPEMVEKFRNLYFSDAMSDDEKKIIWDYFSIFIKLMEKYQKVK